MKKMIAAAMTAMMVGCFAWTIQITEEGNPFSQQTNITQAGTYFDGRVVLHETGKNSYLLENKGKSTYSLIVWDLYDVNGVYLKGASGRLVNNSVGYSTSFSKATKKTKTENKSNK